MQSFMDFCKVYCRFLSSLTRKSAPLNRLFKRGQPRKLDLDEEGTAAVNELKNSLINLSMLALRRYNALFTFNIDAFDKQVQRVVLRLQEMEKDLQPVGYESRTLSEAEKKYDAIQKR